MWVHDQERAHAPRLASRQCTERQRPSGRSPAGQPGPQAAGSQAAGRRPQSQAAAPVGAAEGTGPGRCRGRRVADRRTMRVEPLPRSVLVAAAVEAVEAVGVLAASVLAGIATANGQSYQRASGIAITLIGIATAVGLALVARALAGRPPLVTNSGDADSAVHRDRGHLPAPVGPASTGAFRPLCWQSPGLVALLTPASIAVLTPGRISKS